MEISIMEQVTGKGFSLAIEDGRKAIKKSERFAVEIFGGGDSWFGNAPTIEKAFAKARRKWERRA